jgi:serine/threonine-protein kinase
MSLIPGGRLGPYEILAPLGTGGMGEVYRARDGTLQRDVALKILPQLFARDPDRLARFRREAQVLASLNHPNIAAIYGFEESSSVHALVLELVEGPTLAERIAQGPIPLDEALPIARQIAEALAAAHEHGIIHRDLKPANIKLRPDGMVKVLDFGLAKLTGSAEGGPHAGDDADRGVRRQPDLSASPTITSPAMITGIGTILGTAAYMSPEQAKGREADKRSDIWAFGCVLYEMLTAKRPFEGEDVGDTLANVLKVEPSWSVLSPRIPPVIRMLLQSCMTKDRRRRMADISTALFVLDKGTSFEPFADTRPSSPLQPRPWRRRAAVATAVLVGSAATGSALWLTTGAAPPPVTRLTIGMTAATTLSLQGAGGDVTITPDGSRVVYRGAGQLLVRRLDQLQPTVLAGLGAPRALFISPEGQSIGFFDGVAMRRVAITGGSPQTIAATDGGGPRGATWGPDGTIVYATDARGTGLQRVSAAGGKPTVLTRPDRARGEADHYWPQFLPGGSAVLYTITSSNGIVDETRVAVLDLRTMTTKDLLTGGSHAHYVPTGHLVYAVAGTLRGVAFDLDRLQVVGTAAPVLEQVETTLSGAADMAVAANGSLVYVSAAPRRDVVVAVNRDGRATPLPGIPMGSYRDVRVSPDGARLALATDEDVWIYDLARATLIPLTTESGPDTRPLWTRDGQRVIFRSVRANYPELFWRTADGTGRDERLFVRSEDLLDLRGDGWSADGRLLFTEVSSISRGAIGLVDTARPSDARMLIKDEFYNAFATLSPDGHSIAYQSNLSGQFEIYVQRYPDLTNRQMISAAGGRLPLWSGDGRELFFSEGRQMFVVPVQAGTTLLAGAPRMLFDGAVGPGSLSVNARPYDLTPDGRFMMIRPTATETAEGLTSSLIVVQNWFEELKRLVPVN